MKLALLKKNHLLIGVDSIAKYSILIELSYLYYITRISLLSEWSQRLLQKVLYKSLLSWSQLLLRNIRFVNWSQLYCEQSTLSGWSQLYSRKLVSSVGMEPALLQKVSCQNGTSFIAKSQLCQDQLHCGNSALLGWIQLYYKKVNSILDGASSKAEKSDLLGWSQLHCETTAL